MTDGLRPEPDALAEDRRLEAWLYVRTLASSGFNSGVPSVATGVDVGDRSRRVVWGVTVRELGREVLRWGRGGMSLFRRFKIPALGEECEL